MKEINFALLYNESDKQLMKVAEDSLNPKIDRVNEIIAFANEAKFKKIGIANCISFEKESAKLEELLVNNGFDVSRVHCKLGRLPNDEILPGYKGIACNPAGQATFLNENKTELNIVLGLCVGHDMLFNHKSKALTSTLIVKDRKLKHNTFALFQEEIKKATENQ